MTRAGRHAFGRLQSSRRKICVRVRLREADGRIESAQISGDFFLIPEDSLPKLEMMLEMFR